MAWLLEAIIVSGVKRLSVVVLACAVIAVAIGLQSTRHATATRSATHHHGLALADGTLAVFAERAFHPVAPGNCSVVSPGCVTGCVIPIASRQANPPSPRAKACDAARASRPCMLPVAGANTSRTFPPTGFCKNESPAERNAPKRLP